MKIRKYKESDCKASAKLFYETIHNVNIGDYTSEQLEAWAPGNIDIKKWNQSFMEHYSIVAEQYGTLIGFGDIDNTGYLDRLYVHHDYQRNGIATAICDELEQTTHNKIITHASITARPFFEKRRYIVLKRLQIEKQGIFLTSYLMEKIR